MWPALEAIGVDGQTLRSFDEEHEAMAAGLASARDAMRSLRESASRADADTAIGAIEQLRRTTVTHLDHEEEVTEPALAEHADHPALKEMGRRFSRRSSPAKAGVYVAWLQDGGTAARPQCCEPMCQGP